MFLTEPPRTQYDLNFMLAGVHVRVHPFFWLMSILLGARLPPREIPIWVGAVFVSIIVHEFGHVLAYRGYGLRAHIVLHGFGGLAIADSAYDSRGFGGRRYGQPASQMAVAFAGPAAGFLLAGLVLSAIRAAGHEVAFVREGLLWILPSFEDFNSEHLNTLLWFLLQVNILWGVINLFPVYPLDGGQISRALLTIFNPGEGVKQSLMLSIIVAIGLAVLALARLQQPFMAILFGYLAYQSYATLQAYTGGYGGRGW